MCCESTWSAFSGPPIAFEALVKWVCYLLVSLLRCWNLALFFTRHDESRRYPILLVIMLSAALLAGWSDFTVSADVNRPPALATDNLLREAIDGVESKEVIMSRVSFSPNIELPWHWHPGEEFFYVIEGWVTLKGRGQPDVFNLRGDFQKLPLG